MPRPVLKPLVAALLALAVAPAAAWADDLGSDPSEIAAAGGVRYFAADDGVHGRALWRTTGDGTTPALVKAGAASGLTPVGDLLYFFAGGRPWRTDGSATTPVTVPGGAVPVGVQAWGDRAVLTVARADGAVDLWVADADGSAAERFGVGLHTAGPLVDVGDDRAAFAADGAPWITDGTADGTEPVADVGDPRDIAPVGDDGRFAFSAGHALWGSDGTADGTQKLADGDATAPRPYGGALYFTTASGTWRTDGTAAGTAPAGPEAWSAFGDRLDGGIVARAVDGALWASAGGAAPQRIKDVVPGGARFPEWVVGDGTLFFTAAPPAGGPATLWTSDGTAAGTDALDDLGAPTTLRDLGDGVIGLVADDGEHGREPWITDGTDAGTRIIDINATPVPEDDADDPDDDPSAADDDGPDDDDSAPAPTAAAHAHAPSTPPALSLVVAHRADAALPFRYAVHGTLSGARHACSGTVTVTLARHARAHAVGHAAVTLAKDCTYRATVSKATMKHLAPAGGHLTLTARFHGNRSVAAVSSHAVTVRYG